MGVKGLEFGSKKKQTEIRALSKCKVEDKIALCPHCEEFFIDDLVIYKNIVCPICGRPLERNLTMKGRQVYNSANRKVGSL